MSDHANSNPAPAVAPEPELFSATITISIQVHSQRPMDAEHLEEIKADVAERLTEVEDGTGEVCGLGVYLIDGSTINYADEVVVQVTSADGLTTQD